VVVQTRPVNEFKVFKND